MIVFLRDKTLSNLKAGDASLLDNLDFIKGNKMI
jgi:hypothetical protein